MTQKKGTYKVKSKKRTRAKDTGMKLLWVTLSKNEKSGQVKLITVSAVLNLTAWINHVYGWFKFHNSSKSFLNHTVNSEIQSPVIVRPYSPTSNTATTHRSVVPASLLQPRRDDLHHATLVVASNGGRRLLSPPGKVVHAFLTNKYSFINQHFLPRRRNPQKPNDDSQGTTGSHADNDNEVRNGVRRLPRMVRSFFLS